MCLSSFIHVSLFFPPNSQLRQQLAGHGVNQKPHSISVREGFKLALSVISIFSVLVPPTIILEPPAPVIRAVGSPLRSYDQELAVRPISWLENATLVDHAPGVSVNRSIHERFNELSFTSDLECLHPHEMHENFMIINVSLCPESTLTCVSSPLHFNFVSLIAVRRVWNQGRSLSDILPRSCDPSAYSATGALLLGGDIEINPGPPGQSPPAPPCPVCDKAIGK